MRVDDKSLWMRRRRVPPDPFWDKVVGLLFFLFLVAALVFLFYIAATEGK